MVVFRSYVNVYHRVSQWRDTFWNYNSSRIAWGSGCLYSHSQFEASCHGPLGRMVSKKVCQRDDRAPQCQLGPNHTETIPLMRQKSIPPSKWQKQIKKKHNTTSYNNSNIIKGLQYIQYRYRQIAGIHGCFSFPWNMATIYLGKL